MVERGLGWGIVPEMCLEYFDGIARPLYFENGEPLTRATWLMYKKKALELPQVRVFLDLVRKSNADRQKRDHKDIIPKHQNERKDS